MVVRERRMRDMKLAIARVKYKGKSVSGYVTGIEVKVEPGKWENDMEFRVVNGRKNSGVFEDKEKE